VVSCGLLLLACAACSKPEQANANSTANVSNVSTNTATDAKTAPENIVTASAPEVQIEPNGAAEAVVQVNIASGYHINGNPTSKYQIATKLDIEPGDGITAEMPKYPPAMSKKFPFSEEPIPVYEGQAIIKVALKAGANATKGTHTLRAKLLVQPCDNQACYRPRTIEATLPVAVK
jgi:DsbC/DsbD-like thiol-disulfide interchange protein